MTSGVDILVTIKNLQKFTSDFIRACQDIKPLRNHLCVTVQMFRLLHPRGGKISGLDRFIFKKYTSILDAGE